MYKRQKLWYNTVRYNKATKEAERMKKAIRNTAIAAGLGTLGISAVMYRCGISRKLYLLPKLMAVMQKEGDAQRQYKAVMPAYEAGKAWFEAQRTVEKHLFSFDGLKLYAHFLRCGESKCTVILCHGYRGSGLGDFGGIVRYLYEELGLNILLITERSHGKSEGSHMTYGIKERYDICGWARLIASEYPDHSIFLYGISMGAASVLMTPTTELPENVKGLIGDCGYTSPDDIFRVVARSWFHLPAFPFVNIAEVYARIFGHFNFAECSAKEALSQTKLPVLLFHGTADDFVPAYMSDENYAACSGEKKLVKIKGAYHATSYYIDFEKYTEALSGFIEKHREKQK